MSILSAKAHHLLSLKHCVNIDRNSIPSRQSVCSFVSPCTVMATSFPILRLPSKSIQDVIQHMPLGDQLAISLCSKPSKSAVTRLNHDPLYISIDVSDSIRLIVDFQRADLNMQASLTFYKNTVGQWNLQSCTTAIAAETEVVWEMTGFRFRDWVEHVLEVFKCSRIHTVSVYRTMNEGNCINASKVIKEFRVKTIRLAACSRSLEEKIVTNIQCNDALFVSEPSRNAPMPAHEVLLQNFKSASFASISPGFQLTLNDLLIINSSLPKLISCQISSKDLNIYIKHLINGSHQMLENIQLIQIGGTPWNKKIAMKDVPFIVYSPQFEHVIRGGDWENENYFLATRNNGKSLGLVWTFVEESCHIVILGR